MAYDPTTTGLIASVQRRGLIPNSTATLQSSDILALLNDELYSTIVPMIRDVREEFFVAYFDQPLNSTQAVYAIPPAASTSSLRDVVLIDNNGFMRPLPRIDPSDVMSVPTPISITNVPIQWGPRFYLQDNNVVLYPTPVTTQATTLRMSYFRRPNDLVAASAGYYTVASIGASTFNVTTVGSPTYGVTGAVIDCINGSTPYNTHGDAVTISVSGATWTPTGGVPTNLAVGDYLCLTTTSVVPQIIREGHELLIQATLVKCFEALGMAEGMQAAQSKYQQMMVQLRKELEPRVEGEPQKVMNRFSVFSNFPFWIANW